MKQKKNVRAAKTAEQQIEDIKRAIAKYGDYDGSRARQLEKLQSIKRGTIRGAVNNLNIDFEVTGTIFVPELSDKHAAPLPNGQEER